MALVPGVRALLPRYASLEDPVAELRAACLDAVARLGSRVVVVASGESGVEVGRALVARVGADVVGVEVAGADVAGADVAGAVAATGVLVVGNGSAKRTEKAPGHFDERAEAFDAALGAGLRAGRVAVDAALAEELWADTAALGLLDGRGPVAEVLYDAAPFGVAYWVLVWGESARRRTDGCDACDP